VTAYKPVRVGNPAVAGWGKERAMPDGQAPAPVGRRRFLTGSAALASGAVLYVSPVMLIFLLTQRDFVRSVATSGMKG
jgi:ABC-type glycerol-3-phosphate transport system permease component